MRTTGCGVHKEKSRCIFPNAGAFSNSVRSCQIQNNISPSILGVVQESPNSTEAVVAGPQWTLRQVAMAVYYAEQAHAAQHGGLFTED